VTKNQFYTFHTQLLYACKFVNFIVKNLVLLIPKYHYAELVKKDEGTGACGSHGRGEKSVQGFGRKALRKETTRKTRGIDGMNGSQGDWLGVCGVDSTGSGQGPLVGCCKSSDELLGSGAMKFIS
jgi:hypothetical protein